MEKQFSRNHGSLYDRGRSDSWYRRGRDPHWYPSGRAGFGERLPAVTAEEKAEYNAGYDSSEETGDHKEWN